MFGKRRVFVGFILFLGLAIAAFADAAGGLSSGANGYAKDLNSSDQTYVLVACVGGGHGLIMPSGGIYGAGEMVYVMAIPSVGYRVVAWCGTDNDLSTAQTNTVTMNCDKVVMVIFELVPYWGDANGDDKVDVSDLGILAANYGTTGGATLAMGDFNDDGKVDAGDLGILAAHYGTGTGALLDFDNDAQSPGLAIGDEVMAAKEPTVGVTVLSCGSAGLPLAGCFIYLVNLLLFKTEKSK